MCNLCVSGLFVGLVVQIRNRKETLNNCKQNQIAEKLSPTNNVKTEEKDFR